MVEENELPDDLEVLKSIYPEIQIFSDHLVMDVKLDTEDEISIVWNSSLGKKLQEFKTRYFEPVRFEVKLPATAGQVCFKSSWIIEECLKDMEAKINSMVEEAAESDMIESLLYTIIDYLTVDLHIEYHDHLFPQGLIITESKDHYDHLTGISQIRRLQIFQENRFTCSICLDSHDGLNGILLDCDHAFCKSCFREYVNQIMNSDDVSKLQCPNCPIPNLKNLHLKTSSELKSILFTPKITNQVLQQVLDHETIQKLDSMLHNFLFEKYQQYYPFSCSKCPRCSHWVFRDDVDDKLVQCTNCQLAYCFECNHSWHGTTNYCGSKLNSIPIIVLEEMLSEDITDTRREKLSQMYGRRTLRLAVDAYVSEKLFREAVENEEDLMACPKCSTVVTKSDGCNKMKCAVCSSHFCYLCGDTLDFENPYTHFTELKNACYGKLFEGMAGTEDLI